MSPQLMWTIAGLILTVLTLGAVTISSYNSLDGANAKLVASEAHTIATASKLWLAMSSSTGTFTGVSATALANYIPDLTVSGGGAFESKIVPLGQDDANPVSYTIAVGAPTSKVVITISNVPTELQALITTVLTSKTCTLGAWAANAASLTCNG